MNHHYQQMRKIRQSCRHSSISDHLSSCFSTSPTNGPHLPSLQKAGTHATPALNRAHSGLHGETGGVLGGGGITTLGAFHTFRKPCAAWCQNGKFCRFWALAGGALPKNAESLRDSDALMRVAVPRRRGPAGLRNLFSFLSKLRLVCPALRGFLCVRGGGGITTLGALYVLLKRRTAACQNGSFAVF